MPIITGFQRKECSRVSLQYGYADIAYFLTQTGGLVLVRSGCNSAWTIACAAAQVACELNAWKATPVSGVGKAAGVGLAIMKKAINTCRVGFHQVKLGQYLQLSCFAQLFQHSAVYSIKSIFAFNYPLRVSPFPLTIPSIHPFALCRQPFPFPVILPLDKLQKGSANLLSGLEKSLVLVCYKYYYHQRAT